MEDQLLSALRELSRHVVDRETVSRAIWSICDKNEDISNLRAENERLRAENERLRGALRFYAEPWKYTDSHGDDVSVPDFYSELDFGETARAALEEKK